MHVRSSALFLLFASSAFAQERALLEQWVTAHQQAVLAEYNEMLSMPNIGTDKAGIQRNAEWLQKMLARHGLASEILATSGNPLVYGEKRVGGAGRTILVYAHYDGQPLDAARWKQASPFQPIVRQGRLEDGASEVPDFLKLAAFPPDWRIYARSASDDKAQIEAAISALDALGSRLKNNIRVILDGEEEMGSRSLPDAIRKYGDKLKADVMLVQDGPSHPTNRPTLYFGARGSTSADLTVFGPKFAVHSGHYGNYVPNPIFGLAQLLASMKDGEGRALVKDYYSDVPPLTPAQQKLLAAVPDDEGALKKLFGIAESDKVGKTYQESLQYPSLNVRNIDGGEQGGVIPTRAHAFLELRLVKETNGDVLISRIADHIRRQGFHLVDAPPDDATRARYPKIAMLKARGGNGGGAGGAWRTETDSAEGVRLIAALRSVWGQDPVVIRTVGGSVPALPFIEMLKMPAIALPVVNFDNNQHSDNENLRLGNLWNGIVSLAAAMQSGAK
jgi:acetylornithine deacetylase/succinyl-diaminopimelate desuccinylase-like protein